MFDSSKEKKEKNEKPKFKNAKIPINTEKYDRKVSM